MVSQPMLKIERLCAGYGRSDVIRNIDLRVPAGQLVCLIGSNGGGKSTIMRAISGMIRPTRGEIILGGRNITNLSPSEVASCGLAHVAEGRRIFPSLSVMDNLRLGAYRRKHASTADVAREIYHVMELFPQLRQRSGQHAGTLSGGEQQMLAIGRALMGAPSIILLDEPSMGLAPRLVDEIYCVIRRLRAEGRTILLVEQFANVALNVADFAYVVENGGIVLSGTAGDLLNNPRVREAYIGASGSSHLPSATTRAARLEQSRHAVNNA
jgi:branched-chain amino acid transport system ATP-binding protein